MSRRSAGLDGRSTRWEEHRQARRADLVTAAVAAIDRHGPAASVAQIAASAGVSKPVLYRYFADKDDLYRAVGHWGAAQVVERLLPIIASEDTLRDQVRRAVQEYFVILDEHPQVFLLLVEHRSSDDPLADGKEHLATAFAHLIGDALRAGGQDAGAAQPWAHALIGTGLAVGEWWLRARTMSRDAAADYLTAFVWNALRGSRPVG